MFVAIHKLELTGEFNTQQNFDLFL